MSSAIRLKIHALAGAGWVKPNVLACRACLGKASNMLRKKALYLPPARPSQPRCPVHRVAKQGVSDVLHVHPDLVGPSRLQLALHQRHGPRRSSTR